MHEFFAPASGTTIAVSLQDGREDVFFDGDVRADCGPRAVQLIEMAGEKPSFHFFYGSAAQQFRTELGFKLSESLGLDLSPKLRHTVKSQNTENGNFDSWEFQDERLRAR